MVLVVHGPVLPADRGPQALHPTKLPLWQFMPGLQQWSGFALSDAPQCPFPRNFFQLGGMAPQLPFSIRPRFKVTKAPTGEVGVANASFSYTICHPCFSSRCFSKTGSSQC